MKYEFMCTECGSKCTIQAEYKLIRENCCMFVKKKYCVHRAKWVLLTDENKEE